jgi:hypothetical protein
MSEPLLRCSFCNKDQNDVRKLIAGKSVCICDECVAVCVEIINDDPKMTGEAFEPPRLEPYTDWTARVKCALCGMPIPAAHALVIQERGPLCVGCVGEIEAAIARQRLDDSSPEAD